MFWRESSIIDSTSALQLERLLPLSRTSAALATWGWSMGCPILLRTLTYASFTPGTSFAIFRALTKADILRIVDLQLDLLRKRLAEKKIGLTVSAEAKGVIAERGYDPVYGARPLKRTIQRDVQNPLAMKILGGEFAEGDTLAVSADGKGELVFKKKPVGGKDRSSK